MRRAQLEADVCGAHEHLCSLHKSQSEALHQKARWKVDAAVSLPSLSPRPLTVISGTFPQRGSQQATPEELLKCVCVCVAFYIIPVQVKKSFVSGRAHSDCLSRWFSHCFFRMLLIKFCRLIKDVQNYTTLHIFFF